MFLKTQIRSSFCAISITIKNVNINIYITNAASFGLAWLHDVQIIVTIMFCGLKIRRFVWQKKSNSRLRNEKYSVKK